MVQKNLITAYFRLNKSVKNGLLTIFTKLNHFLTNTFQSDLLANPSKLFYFHDQFLQENDQS